ncbi:glycosyltransferase family 2 protein [uncultured Moraxella sp.]|uniref:glycosyltransferase family 2 protein n=1 Tax=uncultured Moraxella sp. TaxID=263769 RepID=UPI0025D0E27D|nr:glycosyltransferase family 2 protein [uncultured Moraxella sp.]
MKFAIFSMVKNEADIIESFVRHNLNFADEMYILDNGSTDNTLSILKNLYGEGLPIRLFQDTTHGHRQHQILSNLMQHIQGDTDADIFMCLDADEFISISPNSPPQYRLNQKAFFDQHLQAVARYGVCAMQWVNYLPNDSCENLDFINYFDDFARCQMSVPEHQKVIFSRDMLAKVVLAQGNHFLSDKNTQQKIQHLVFQDIVLAHIPIRSAEQAISKVLTTAISVSSREMGMNESFHIFNMKEKIINNNYTLAIDECRELAHYYGLPEFYREQVVLGKGRINDVYIEHKYLDLINLSIVHNLREQAEIFAKKTKDLTMALAAKEQELTTSHQRICELERLLKQISQMGRKYG